MHNVFQQHEQTDVMLDSGSSFGNKFALLIKR